MTTEPKTGPQCLYVVWDENFALKGAAFYEQTVYRDAEGKIEAIKQGDAQPVATLGQKGIDITGIIGKIGADALVLAETKAAELDAAREEVQRITGERDGWQARVNALQTQVDELTARLNAPIMRVPTAALLIVLRKRGLRAQFDDVCASLPPEQQEYVKEMLQMPYTRRDHPLVELFAQAFGYTPEQTDGLFAEADQV